MEETIKDIIEASHSYKKADQALEKKCGEDLDPIACTVFARKGMHHNSLPEESFDAAFYLNKVVSLHEILVKKYNMDTDVVRSYWFPILNA